MSLKAINSLPSVIQTHFFKWKFTVSSRLFNLIASTCTLKLASPHAFSRSGALGAIGSLTAGLSAVAGEEDLSLVDPAVVFRRTAD